MIATQTGLQRYTNGTIVWDMPAPTIPKNPAHRRAWILYQLRLRGETLGTLAKRHGVSRKSTSTAMTRSYPRMEQIIAAAIDLSPQTVWPERYDHNGRPLGVGRPLSQLVDLSIRQRKRYAIQRDGVSAGSYASSNGYAIRKIRRSAGGAR